MATKTAKRSPKIVKKGTVTSIADHAKKKAGKAAAEPKEAYDALSQTQQDLWDEIGKMGFRPEKLSSGFIGTEINWDTKKQEEPRRFGPFESLVILHNEIRDEVAKHPTVKPEPEGDGVIEVDETEKGRRLPGMGVRVVKSLDELIKRRVAATKVFTEASAKVQEVNKEILDAFEANRSHFVEYPEKKKHIYKSPAGGELRIKHSVTDTIETVLGDDEEED